MSNASIIWRTIGSIRASLDEDHSLAALAHEAGWSTSHFHRQFTALARETPKQATTRLRLARAAVELTSSDRSVLDIALDLGFASHEVFTRAFRRHFGQTPSVFRRHSLDRSFDRDVAESTYSCVNLYGTRPTTRQPPMTTPPTVERRHVEAQPILFIQRRVAQADLQATMGECFGILYQHGIAKGLAIAGHPITRYVDTGMGLWTIDFVMPLAEPAAADGEIQAGAISAGPAAVALHVGPYEALNETHTAIEQWIGAEGLEVGGAPWEHYLTDPAEEPDPARWRTNVFWPLRG